MDRLDATTAARDRRRLLVRNLDRGRFSVPRVRSEIRSGQLDDAGLGARQYAGSAAMSKTRRFMGADGKVRVYVGTAKPHPCPQCGVMQPRKPRRMCGDCFKKEKAAKSRVTTNCGRCGKAITYAVSQPRAFCSAKCRRAPRRQFKCEACGKRFVRTAAQTRRPNEGTYCSASCRLAGRRDGSMLRCRQCRSEFYRKKSEASKSSGSFCSKKCWALYVRNRATSYPKIGSRHAHRIFAERKLGRPLRPGEIVHHIDGDRKNYDPSNLEILPSQSEHVKLHAASGDFARWRHGKKGGKA